MSLVHNLTHPVELTPEEEEDVLALITWAIATKPGIPLTRILRGLYRKLNDRARGVA